MNSINGIEINGNSVANAIRQYYPASINLVENKKLFQYILMFGIRVGTCDTSLPDDFLGAIRLEKSKITGNPFWNILITDGTVDPSPYWLKNYIDESARKAGATAWVKEGQYIYYLMDRLFYEYPAFAPKPGKPVSVYRWMPKYAGEKFDASKAILGTSTDTLIHRNLSLNQTKEGPRFVADSGGCQVVTNNAILFDLKKWAQTHKEKYKLNSFTYTLLTKEQFTNANKYQY